MWKQQPERIALTGFIADKNKSWFSSDPYIADMFFICCWTFNNSEVFVYKIHLLCCRFRCDNDLKVDLFIHLYGLASRLASQEMKFTSHPANDLQVNLQHVTRTCNLLATHLQSTRKYLLSHGAALAISYIWACKWLRRHGAALACLINTYTHLTDMLNLYKGLACMLCWLADLHPYNSLLYPYNSGLYYYNYSLYFVKYTLQIFATERICSKTYKPRPTSQYIYI